MKKLLLIGTLLAACLSNVSAASLVVNATTNGYYLLSTNRASVYSVEITGAYPGVVTLYDCDTVAAPFYGTNYTNATYYGRTSYPTNMVSSYTNLQGIVSWFTNTGLFTLNVTNTGPQTNVLPVQAAFVVAGGTYAVYSVDALFARGITATITTNVSLVINYRNAQ